MERMDLNEARSRIRARSDLNVFISLSEEQGSGDVVAVKDLVDVASVGTAASWSVRRTFTSLRTA
jgi:hypothetical protein